MRVGLTIIHKLVCLLFMASYCKQAHVCVLDPALGLCNRMR